MLKDDFVNPYACNLMSARTVYSLMKVLFDVFAYLLENWVDLDETC